MMLIEQAQCLPIKMLRKNGYMPKGRWMSGEYAQKETDIEVYLESDLTKSPGELRLTYEFDEVEHDYIVTLHEVQSNLGKGSYLLFVCPVSGKRTSKLYLDSSSGMFVCRSATIQRLYYPSQCLSTMDRLEGRKEQIDKKLIKHLLQNKVRYREKFSDKERIIEKLLKKRNATETLICYLMDKSFSRFNHLI